MGYFVLLVAVYTVIPLAAAALPAWRRPMVLHVYIGIVLTVAAILGQVYALELGGPVVVSGGSMAFAAIMYSAVVLVIVTQEAAAARRVALLVLAANAGILVINLVTAQVLGQGVGTVNPFGVPSQLFTTSSCLVVVGGLLNVAELLALVVVVEATKGRLRSNLSFSVLALVVFIAMIGLDGLLFPTLGRGCSPTVVEDVAGGVLNKAVLGGAFAVPLALFLALFPTAVGRFRQTPLHVHELVVAPRDDLVDRLERREAALARAQSQVEALVDGVTDGLVAVDARGTVTFANQTAHALFEMEARSLLGTPLWTHAPDLLGIEDTATGSGASRVRIATLQGQARTRVLEARAFPTSSAALVFLRDVTEERRDAARLATAQEAEMAAAQRLHELDRAKSAFLTATSHEIRTPLTVITGVTELLSTSPPPGEQQRLLAALGRQVDRLSELITDLLDLERLSTAGGPLARTLFDLIPVARQAIHAAGLDERTSVDAPASLDVVADPAQVSRILSNLLANADKYAPGAPVAVRLERLGATGCRIDVVDHGPGLPAEEHERVFEPFYRADFDHPQPGTGVGLALVREFARLHGGTAEIVNRHAGLHVRVDLPGAPAPG